AGYDLNYVYEYPTTINEDEITEMVMKVLQDMDGDRLHMLEKPSMGGEDFAFFLEEVPGTYMFLGSTNPEEEITPIHTPEFDLDESILPLGVEVFCRLAFNYLNE
ncbi:MAG: M20/M25/M40 family metallo-hydrolase, partial [Halanaerobiales bacterium]